ncbi:ABC transporter substrate-binding protein [Salinibacterium hongtaonis]|uniref:Thiamine pyrimidine synthase n=1 Tax=Homoserinimonas hongtaonis TaxID=2079791 RepID=A0A2U1SZW4_9MICO|nr:ABC transporter substrate-binding protein [Salinibacterium hongtaonis]PWB97160.1 ABC transporter substrate-binding protein [Salinibacterium hongtaonis]
MFPVHGFTRRAAAATAGAATLALLLGACAGSSAETPSGEDGSFGDIAIQLSWIKNAEFAGEFFAEERGYFADAGFDSVELVPGPVSTEAAVISGNVIMGLGNAISAGSVIAEEGAPITIIGTTYQKNPFTILSLEDHGNIATVDDLKGKTIGVQASNQNLWEAFLALNDLTLDDVNTVPVEYDPTPLFTGELDGWFAYLTNEALDAELQGLKPVNLPFADNGMPFVAESLIVNTADIESNRELLKALLVAEIKGWTDAIAETDEAARLAVEVFGSDLGLTMEKELLQAQVQARDLIVSDETEANGLFTISEKMQELCIQTLAAAGIEVTADLLFDMSLLAEVYEENPELLDYAK